MSTPTTANPHLGAEEPRPFPARATRRTRLMDIAALAAFVGLGIYLISGLYPDPYGMHVTGNRQDSVQLQWLLLHATRLFTHGENPLFTTLINAPYGVNLMANTSILAFAIPLTPVTLAFGPAVSAVVLLTLAPAATAAAWYHVLSRHIVTSRLGAFIGALFAGYAPAMVSHDTGHPNIVAQFILPYLVLTVLKVRIPGRAVRTGLELAGLVVIQIFINEEILFLTAVTLGMFILAVLAMRPGEILPHVRSGLIMAGVAAAVAGAVVAYPLLWQFSGPMAYQGLPHFVLDYGNDLASFPAFATESLVGPTRNAKAISANLTEQNTFYGWPLLILLAGICVQLRRSFVARAAYLTCAVIVVLSLGQTVVINGKATSFKGPWALVSQAPLFDAVVPTRLTLFATPLIALVLAMSVDHARSHRLPDGVTRAIDRWTSSRSLAVGSVARRVPRLAWIGLVIAALVPIAPTPIDVAPNVRTPRFFTSGTWRHHVDTGSTVLPVPMGWDENVDIMQWQVAVDIAFATPGGYYLAPAPTGSDRRANFGPVYTPTANLLLRVASGSEDDMSVTPDDAMADLRQWAVDVVLMPDSAPRRDALRQTVDRLVGPGTHIDDVWIWKIH